MATLISLLLPTRGRPELARRFMDSVQEQSNELQDVEVILRIDEDDIGSHDLDCPGLKITKIIDPCNTMGALNTACLIASHGDIVILVNDDMVIRTRGWDEQLRQLDDSVQDKIYLAYCNDLFKKGSLCTFPILSRRACDVLQQPYHHAYRGAFIDYHLMDIFKRLEHVGYRRIFYLGDVVFEHLHYRTGKAAMDATYKARGRFDDDMLFIGLADVRKASLALLLDAIAGTNKAQGWALPEYTEMKKPSPLSAVIQFGRIFLGDADLPVRWRFFMWWWFCARNIASRVFR